MAAEGARGADPAHRAGRYPAIQFEDGSVYREESKDMVTTIESGKLLEKAGGDAAPSASA